ncbi:alpha-N-acetylgalactosaminidase [Caerostris extrusa]|uniref:Alpha-galactosidase n=1 Tax=Caerostris extrusa TaxID=172846 RepID=A0AAV4TRR6_CAEEX|nr:alpha-N-acetylgalactosaminidase [Caerostris extrusa]
MNRVLSFYLILWSFSKIYGLENGLARTPPMGWLAWERFKCNTNCYSDPDNCISEKLFMKMADKLVEEGYRDAGYVHINIDDCWMAQFRDSKGNMVPDPKRFSRGIKFLADYMHKRGLKLGIYQDFGAFTCMGYPGIIGHMRQDAKAFAKWKVDMVKLDGCHSKVTDLDDGYVTMGKYLNETNRPMIYSCSWPYYQLINQLEPNYKLISKHCNLWRNYHDIQDSWESISRIIDFFGDNQEVISLHVGPGHWSDPDMLMIGNFHLTPGQARAQMAVWSILPAPLLMSNDLRDMKPVFKEILLNAKAIAIDQDPLGLPGKRIYKKNHLEIWMRHISPSNKGEFSCAVLFLNRDKYTKVVKILLKELGMNNTNGYHCVSVFSDQKYNFHDQNDILSVGIEPMDVFMLNCQIIIK